MSKTRDVLSNMAIHIVLTFKQILHYEYHIQVSLPGLVSVSTS